MALFIIPVDSADPYYSLDVTLSGSVYRFTLQWNGRGGFWTMDISDTSDNPLITSLRLTASWELISQFGNPLLPAGNLYCVDMGGLDVDPTDTDLGTRVLLVYDDGLP
jgi:hypothetical protein